MKRMVAIWFPHLVTDWMSRKKPSLKEIPFALVSTERSRRVIKAANAPARAKGIGAEMAAADARALVPELKVFDFDAGQREKTLRALAEWCIRYSPSVGLDPPNGLVLDASGCTHLWGGETKYLEDIAARLTGFGYTVRTAMADTIMTARAVSRHVRNGTIVSPGKEAEALSPLPAMAICPDAAVAEKLVKLGLLTVGSFMRMPRTALRRRFGPALLACLDQALGAEMEIMEPVRPPAPFREQLPSLEPIRTAAGIEIAITTLLEMLCARMGREQKGLRQCELRCYRIDGLVKKIAIGTGRPSRNIRHLSRLFSDKIAQVEPGLGIELFILEAPVVEDLPDEQDALWNGGSSHEAAIAELLDRLAGRTGGSAISRFLPAEHYWPERSVRAVASLSERSATAWRTDLPRPVHLLHDPEQIEVSVPLPDYPPLLFKYRGALHTVKKADGPERIEQEWWIESGRYRDYYCVEDERGARYWLFRSGDYNSESPKWYVHGFFA